MDISRIRILAAVFCIAVAGQVHASHYRGATWTAVNIDANGVITATLVSSWAKGSSFGGSVPVLNASRTSVGSLTIVTNVNDTSNAGFDTSTTTLSGNISAQPQGRYSIYWTSGARVSGILNTSKSSSWGLEAVVDWNGTANGPPAINSAPNTVIAKGNLFSQNVNASDPEGTALSYQFMTDVNAPVYGASLVPNLNLDGDTGQMTMTAADTTSLTAGRWVAKIRVTDASGAFTDRDIMFDVLTTANNPPVIDAIPGGTTQTVVAGQMLSFNVTASDPDAGNLVTLSASGVPANASFTPDPAANPVSGAFVFTPLAGQVGTTFGINFDAVDNDGSVPLSASANVQITVVSTPPPNPPVRHASTPAVTHSDTPTWVWVSGGNGGNGTYRYKLNDSFLSAGATVAAATSFTPGSALPEGTHTLYVQERNDDGSWSNVTAMDIQIDYGYVPPSTGFVTHTRGGGSGATGLLVLLLALTGLSRRPAGTRSR